MELHIAKMEWRVLRPASDDALWAALINMSMAVGEVTDRSTTRGWALQEWTFWADRRCAMSHIGALPATDSPTSRDASCDCATRSQLRRLEVAELRCYYCTTWAS